MPPTNLADQVDEPCWNFQLVENLCVAPTSVDKCLDIHCQVDEFDVVIGDSSIGEKTRLIVFGTSR
jgi:hypothetical protein